MSLCRFSKLDIPQEKCGFTPLFPKKSVVLRRYSPRKVWFRADIPQEKCGLSSTFPKKSVVSLAINDRLMIVNLLLGTANDME